MRFTHNGHHHCKRTSPPAIRKLKVCRPADIFPALFPTCVQLFNNWRVGMVVTVGLASADLQPPWWRGPVGSHDDFIKWKPFPRYWPFVCVCVCVCVCVGGGGGLPVTDEFASQRPVTRSFDVFFDLCLNKRLSKQSWGWWLDTTSRSLWRRCNDLRT